MNHYIYDGIVLEFDRVVAHNWHGETTAITEKKARNNLAFQFKIETGRTKNCKITLPAKLKIKE